MARFLTYIVTVILLLSNTSIASAQESNTRKLFLQTSIDAQSLNYNEDNFDSADRGGGFSFRAGWGISDLTTLYIGINGSRMNDVNNGVIDREYEFGAFEIGSRFNFRSGQPLVPFVDVALRGVATQLLDIDLEFLGGGITIGGGASYFVSPTVALNAGLRVGFGGFNEIRFGQLSTSVDSDEFGYGEARFSFGVIFYPLKP